MLLLGLEILAVLLAILYIWTIYQTQKGWNATPTWKIPAHYKPSTKVSVIIPARNEARHILSCLKSISEQDYPTDLLEIIVVDDFSEDETAEQVTQFEHPSLRLIRLAEVYPDGRETANKKRGISLAVEQAGGELILGTDADTIVHPNWLLTMASYFETHQPVFMAAPVSFLEERSLLERFQSLDFLGMMAVTASGIQQRRLHMSNGANLGYQRSAFLEVEGFSGNEHLSSGDDIFLIQKMAQHFPGRVHFVKSRGAVVRTKAMPDWRSFVAQRLRWSTKNTSYPEWRVTATLLIVFKTCWAILLSPIFAIWLGWEMLVVMLGLLLVKSLADYLYLSNLAKYFGRSDLMRSFIPAQFLHILYIALVGLLGNVRKEYSWKGRKVR